MTPLLGCLNHRFCREYCPDLRPMEKNTSTGIVKKRKKERKKEKEKEHEHEPAPLLPPPAAEILGHRRFIHIERKKASHHGTGVSRHAML